MKFCGCFYKVTRGGVKTLVIRNSLDYVTWSHVLLYFSLNPKGSKEFEEFRCLPPIDEEPPTITIQPLSNLDEEDVEVVDHHNPPTYKYYEVQKRARVYAPFFRLKKCRLSQLM